MAPSAGQTETQVHRPVAALGRRAAIWSGDRIPCSPAKRPHSLEPLAPSLPPMTIPRPAGLAPRSALTAALCCLVASSAGGQQEGPRGAVQVSPGLSKRSILRGIEGTVGCFELETSVDMAAAGVPGLEFKLTGTSQSQLLLGGEALLTVTNMEGMESVTLLGARNDSEKLFNLTLDGARTAITYAEGDVTGEGALILSDPFKTFRSATMFVEEGGTLTKVFIGPDWKELSETRARRTRDEPRDVLSALLAREVLPEQFNRTSEDPDPARNYAPEHAGLVALAGDYEVHGGGEADRRFHRARLVGNGRYLLCIGGAPGRSGAEEQNTPGGTAPLLDQVDQVTVVGFDSVRRVYQMFRISGADGPVHYCEGAPRADGGLVLRDLIGRLTVKVSPGEAGAQRWEWTVGRSAPVEVLLRPAPTAEERGQ